MTRFVLVPSLMLALPAAASSVPPASPSTPTERKAVTVTVYNDGRGRVREERQLALQGGESELRFMDVAEKIEAATVKISVLEGGALSVHEQNYEYDLLS